jgi:hypothetical protein
MTAQPLHIVLAEDEDGHATLVQRNLERSGVQVVALPGNAVGGEEAH